MNEEFWLVAAGFPDYEVSSLGRVRRLTTRTSTKAGRILKASMHYRGYLHHGLGCDGKTISVRLNRLVCATFHGPAPSPEHEAAHRDGDRLNNREDNLSWLTKDQNEEDKVRHGSHVRGTDQPTAKLDEDAVRFIREHSKSSKSYLADRFGVCKTTIENVLNGVTWRHVA